MNDNEHTRRTLCSLELADLHVGKYNLNITDSQNEKPLSNSQCLDIKFRTIIESIQHLMRRVATKLDFRTRTFKTFK